ncbi:MAG: hypothetical protein AABY15_02915 [Nanoarchaeota archaeon]
MKKFIIFIFISLAITSCEFSAQEETTEVENLNGVTVRYFTKRGMDYMIISTSTGAHVINLTLDSLMVNHYSKQLIEIDS